jgi:hypothetical protein
MSVDLSPELKLAAALSAGIARFLHGNLGEQDNPGLIFHSFQGPFDVACFALWELDVARATPKHSHKGLGWENNLPWAAQDPKEIYGYFIVLEPEQAREKVLARGAISAALLDDLIEIYIDAACEYGINHENLLPVTREPFETDSVYWDELNALADCGYAAWKDGKFAWTDAMGKAMQARRFWDEHNAASTEDAKSNRELIRSREKLAVSIQNIPEIYNLLRAGLKSDALEMACAQTRAHFFEVGPILNKIDKLINNKEK